MRSEATTSSTDRPVFFIDAATQIENLGDDVILRQLLRLLEARGEVRVDVSNTPAWAREVIEIDPTTSDDRGGFARRLLGTALRSRLRRDRRSMTLVLKPGHVGGRYGFRFSLGRLGLLGLTACCRLLGVGVIRVGFSVNDCQGALLPIERLQSRAQSVYAPRDDVSVAYAHEVGIRVTGRSTDLAYTLGVAPEVTDRRSGTVLSFAGSTDGHTQPAYADRLTGFLRSYLDRVPGDYTWCAQVVRDAIFGDHVLAGRIEVARIAFDRDAASAAGVFDTYANAEVVLTNRLHSFLFALSRGALAIVVTDPATHGKIVGIIDELGLPELLVDLDGLEPETLRQHVEDVLARREPITARISEYFGEQTARMAALLDESVGAEQPFGGTADADRQPLPSVAA